MYASKFVEVFGEMINPVGLPLCSISAMQFLLARTCHALLTTVSYPVPSYQCLVTDLVKEVRHSHKHAQRRVSNDVNS